MPRPKPNKYWLLKRLLATCVFIAMGSYLFLEGYPKPSLSWGRLYWLSASLISFSLGVAFFTSKNNILANAMRVFLGMVFLYSGFVKVVDPLGSTYKFIDYFDAWHISFMEPYSLPLSFLMSASEMVVGAALLLNSMSGLASLGALIFMVYFTPVTLYLALQQEMTGKEIVHDCGCFGDALILTNWQTFVKCVILLGPSIYVYVKRKAFEPILLKHIQGILVGVCAVIALVIGYWGLEHLPLIDFRPFKVGTNIPEKMSIPPGAPQPVYDTFLAYKDKKTGQVKEFTLQNYPQDTLWEFVDTRNVLIEEGYVPPIHDFSITNGHEGDITDVVLQDEKYSFLLVAYNLNKTSLEHMPEINKLYDWCRRNNVAFRCLTASLEVDVARFKQITGAKFGFYNTDPITLKTIVRANPGLVLLRKGTVVDKWHHNDLPSILEFEGKLMK